MQAFYPERFEHAFKSNPAPFPLANVRPAGLRYEDAAYKLHDLLAQARQRQLSGVELKDETGGGPELLAGAAKNFLL
jgi:ethanolamine ammonia-lyase small subunit